MDSLRLRKESLSIFFNGAPPQSPSPKKKDSRFRGVRKRPGGRFAAEIHIPLKKKSRWLGTFSTAEEAARAYDKVARAIHGPTAKTNFVYADFSGIQPPPLLTLPRSSGEVPGRKLEYRRSPVYISGETVGVPRLCWEYKGYKLEDAGRVGTSQGEEKKVVSERKEPLLFDLNKPAPFFRGIRDGVLSAD